MNREEQADIVVCLAKKEDDVWRRFGENALHEMPVDMNGRRIFPRLKYHIEGLEEERQYAIFLEFQQVDDERQGSSNPEWKKSGDMNNLEYNKIAQKIRHKNISKSGKFWMSKGVNFDHIMMTIDPTRKDLVFLQEMHKYIPVLSIYECASKFRLPRQESKPVVVFRVDYTEFIAVTKHQNEAAIALKNEHNRVLRENRMNNNRERQKFLNRARLVIEASKELPASGVPAPIKILPRPHFEHNMPTNYPYHPPVQTTNNKRSHNFAVPEDSSQPKRERLDVPSARGLPTGAVLHPYNMIPPHQFQPNRFQSMNNSYPAQPQAAYMNRNQFFVPPNGSHVGLQQGSEGMRGLPADARVPTMLPPHFTPYDLVSPNYTWYPQQQAANNNRNQFIPPFGGSNIVLRQTQPEVFNAPATTGLPTGGVPAVGVPHIPTVHSLNHFTPNTMIPANNVYHPRLVAANNQQSLSVLSSNASQVAVPEAKREQLKFSSMKESPAIGVPRISTVYPPHQVTKDKNACHPQLEIANNKQGRFVFPLNSKIAVPQATRKEIEIPSSSSTLPPQSTPSTSILKGMDRELILLAPPNNNLSVEFLKLAFLNALILFEVRWPPGTSINSLVEAYSLLAPKKNTDLKP